MRIIHVILLFIVTCLIGSQVHAQQRTPVIEYASLLNSFGVSPDGWLEFNRSNDALTSVFLPSGAEIEAVVTKSSSDTPIYTQSFAVQPVTKVFSRIDQRGAVQQFKFEETGDYVLTFRSGTHVMSVLEFTVYTRKSDDEFDPRVVWYTDGPWADWAYAYSKLSEGGNGTLQFRMWAKRESFESGTKSDIYDVDLKKDGDIVAVGKSGYISTQRWRNLHFVMRHPESKGGRNFSVKQLAARDGKYQFVVKKNGEFHAVYEMVVENGKAVLHPREADDHEPRHQYICPRYAALTDGAGGAGNTVWMDRLDDDAAKSVAAEEPKAVAGASAEQRRRWEGLPTTVDPNRPFEIVVTNVETRSDTHLSAGEDIIAFGTGHPTGVQYLVVGEDKAREIPNGEVYSSTLFHVCGKKIVLIRKKQIYVYDTQTDTTTSIPASDVSLYNPVGGLHNGSLLSVDGNLVAAVCEATSVADGNIIKVIDVSGDKPVVIPIKNANYNDRQVSSVALDAKNGLVAVSSAEKKLIAVAKVAPLANQNIFDMTDYRGVNRRQIYIDGDMVTYADSDLKIRVLKAGDEAPVAITEEALGSGNNGFVVRNGRLAVTTQEHVGTRYQIAVSDLPNKPMTLSGTGTAIPETSGGLGMAGCAAIAIDKTIFIAGTPSGGIGVGEHLQMLDKSNNTWFPLTNEQDQVISAIDVTASYCTLAFKSADHDRRTTIGYATFGQRIEIDRSDRSIADTSKNQPKTSGTREIPFADDNPYNTHDEIALSQLESYLETEKSVSEAYIQAFGKEEGTQKTIDAVLSSMKQNGHDNLINEYLRLSTLVSDQDRPQSKEAESNGEAVDQAAVESALNGEWKAIRFSAAGNDLPDKAIEQLRLTFTDGKYVMNMPGGLQTGTYEVDTTEAPMKMDINIGSGDHKDEKRMGSFKLLKGDRLLMVFATNEEKRPSRFIPDESGSTIMVVYEKLD